MQELGDQLNHMATQLQGPYATLERKVEERTHQLQAANLSKSRFIAAASHDLRQPLHALNLFVAQLRTEKNQAERERLTTRIDAAIGNMDELFNALLDISRLDAGALSANISDFPIVSILKRIETTFSASALEKGLHFRMVPSTLWVRSDPILLERILLNLVSNAVRYTPSGGIVVGCRHAGDRLRIEVHDSGIGIPDDQQCDIFSEFYQVETAVRAQHDGLGLGLAIVDRLCALLDHPIRVKSAPSKGSCFQVSIPVAAALARLPDPSFKETTTTDPLSGKLVVVVDDDALVLEGTGGLLKSWGCRVITATSSYEALAALHSKKPDLIISDFRLKDGRTGIDSIAHLRDSFQISIPAFLVSGDILPERLAEAKANGHQLLHKPLSPMTLRTVMSRLLKESAD